MSPRRSLIARRRAAAVALVATLALLVGGCGSGSESSPGEDAGGGLGADSVAPGSIGAPPGPGAPEPGPSERSPTRRAASEPAASEPAPAEPAANQAALAAAAATDPRARGADRSGPVPSGAADPADAAPELGTPAGAYPVVWVRRGRQVEIRSDPGGGEVVARVGKRTEFGSPTVFGVVRHAAGWVGVATPLLANGRLGWIKLDPRRLAAGWTKVAVHVDLSDRRAVVREGGEAVQRFAVTVGAPGNATPRGRFAVTDTFRGGLEPAYGCCALALSATQPHLPSGWLGGNRIAIHGTSGPLGVAESHGCVRAANEDVDALIARVPLGAPVFIRA